MANYPTPHINANPDDFGKTVIMPGDPLRSKFIAENFLTDAVLVNNVRGVNGYTGFYDGKKVTVMASGMGMPSIGIYSHELFNFFGVDNIIRAGSAGSMQEDIKIRDIVIASSASTDSAYIKRFGVPGTIAPTASYPLLKRCVDNADEMKLNYHVGSVLSTDIFYNYEEFLPDSQKTTPRWSAMGVMAVEMEAAALYLNAMKSGKNALAVCTISDSLITGECTSAEEREKSFVEMIELCLKTAL